MLRRAKVGRIGLSVRALPVIIPVRFVLAGDAIIFSPPEACSDGAVSGNVVCFEAGELNREDEWSVLVTGMASPVQPDEERDLLRVLLDDAGLEGHLMRIGADLISGRRGPLVHRALASA